MRSDRDAGMAGLTSADELLAVHRWPRLEPSDLGARRRGGSARRTWKGSRTHAGGGVKRLKLAPR